MGEPDGVAAGGTLVRFRRAGCVSAFREHPEAYPRTLKRE